MGCGYLHNQAANAFASGLKVDGVLTLWGAGEVAGQAGRNGTSQQLSIWISPALGGTPLTQGLEGSFVKRTVPGWREVAGQVTRNGGYERDYMETLVDVWMWVPGGSVQPQSPGQLPVPKLPIPPPPGIIPQNPNDPCAGKKDPSKLNYEQGSRQSPDEDGAATTAQHIQNRHLEQIPGHAGQKSYYLFAPKIMAEGDMTIRLTEKWRVVLDYNAATLMAGTGVRQRNGNIAYVASFPIKTFRNILGITWSVEVWIGRDSENGFQMTNVNSLILKPDCVTVVTSFPGLATDVTAGDARIGRVGGTRYETKPVWKWKF
jgi:hypothetical protein